MIVKISHVFASVSRIVKKATLWTVISIGIITLVALLSPQEKLLQFNRLIQDFIISTHGHSVQDDIIIVAIDDKSIAALGRWPWRRTLHAELLDRIYADRPKAIGLDILFTEPERAYQYDDTMLAASIKRNAPVVLPVFIQNQGTASHIITPLPTIANNAAQLGQAHIIVDEDGIVRSAYLLNRVEGTSWKHFGQAMLSVATNSPVPVMTNTSPEGMSAINNTLTYQYPMLVRFAGGAGHFKRVSYIDVIQGSVPKGTFVNKYVLVGATVVGIADQYATPMSSRSNLMPGVEILANITDSLLHDDYIQPASTAQNIILNLLFVIIALIGFVLLSPFFALLLTVFLIAALFFTSYFAIDTSGILFSPAAGILGLILIYPLWSWHRLNAATRYLTSEFESFQRERNVPFTASAPFLVKDFLDRRIIALKGATQQLQGLHQFVTDSINNLPSPTLISDRNGQIRIANLAAARHFNLTNPQILLAQYIPPLVSDIVANNTLLPLITEEVITGSAVPVKGEAKDSQGRELIVKCVPIFNADNIHSGWILSIDDVSKMRQAERDREEAFRFITHDIRSPLSSIISLLELHQLNPGKNSSALIQGVERFANSALTLADNFINLSRAKSGEYHFELLNLNDLLSEVVDESWATAQINSITIKITMIERSAYTMADRQMFKRALTNLISNAIKFSPDNSHIFCTISSKANQWDIAITDHGAGIPPEMLDTLFQPFNRLHVKSHPQIGGTGLGLSFVYSVIKRHGGNIFVESKVNEGSTFHLLMPMVAAHALGT